MCTNCPFGQRIFPHSLLQCLTKHFAGWTQTSSLMILVDCAVNPLSQENKCSFPARRSHASRDATGIGFTRLGSHTYFTPSLRGNHPYPEQPWGPVPALSDSDPFVMGETKPEAITECRFHSRFIQQHDVGFLFCSLFLS